MFRLRHVTHWLAAIALALLLPVAGQAAQSGPEVAEPFRDYYARHQGIRVLGYPLTGLVEDGGYAAQYFEKGRIEDHRGEAAAPAWAFMYGRLTAELLERDPQGSVTGTSITYGELQDAAAWRNRHAPPPGFRGGTAPTRGGTFVPYDPFLRPAPGSIVPATFWRYINRVDLFPGGWLHDIGLPMTDAFMVSTYKYGEWRDILIQGFERTVLTYDPQNPASWQVERGNIGADALRTLPAPQPQGPIESPPSGARDAAVAHPGAYRPAERADGRTLALAGRHRTVARLSGAAGRGWARTADRQLELDARRPTTSATNPAGHARAPERIGPAASTADRYNAQRQRRRHPADHSLLGAGRRGRASAAARATDSANRHGSTE
jgi:hypothetical protein